MYKKRSEFMQSPPHTAVGRDDSLIPAPTCSPRYAQLLHGLLESTKGAGVTQLIKDLSDYPLAQLIVAFSTETNNPNRWLESICIAVDDQLYRDGPNVRLSRYQRHVAETVIPEILNRARNSAEIV